MKLLEKLIRKPKVLQRTIGLSLEQFQLLVLRIKIGWEISENKRKSHDKRVRAMGGGRTYKLMNLEEKVLVVLLYYKSLSENSSKPKVV